MTGRVMVVNLRGGSVVATVALLPSDDFGLSPSDMLSLLLALVSNPFSVVYQTANSVLNNIVIDAGIVEAGSGWCQSELECASGAVCSFQEFDPLGIGVVMPLPVSPVLDRDARL